MSIWKLIEYWYFEDEKNFGYNPFWWTAWTTIEFTPDNKKLYRTMLRVAKNKKRKLKTININHYKRK